MIGIFDSGVGGMTVARAIEKILPEYRQIYFGDLARTPYGSKSPETIIKYACQNSDFLMSKGAKILIIACNSAASVASEQLGKQYDVPVFEVITPAVEQAVEYTGSGRIGVIGTRATIASGIYHDKIKALDSQCQVYSNACPLLVPLVEEGWINKQETKMILRRYLSPLKSKSVDTLVLGCTHYPLLIDLIRPRIGKRVRVIDSSKAIATVVRKYVEDHPEIAAGLSRDGENQYYVSDVTDAALSTAHKIFNRKITLTRVNGK
ncbi:glutamate racemase [Thermodesulfobacteriota bacterium]